MYLNFSIDRLRDSIVTENNIYDAIPFVVYIGLPDESKLD